MSTKQQILKSLNVQAAEAFVDSVRFVDDYFVYAARHTPFSLQIDRGTDNNPPQPQDTTANITSTFDNLLFGKRVKQGQASNMIRRIPWVEGQVYDMYSDIDPDLDEKKFYVTIDNGIDILVYKCLFNNNGKPSTQQPFGTNPDAIEFPQDGYIWKYMFTVDTFNIRQFATLDYIPTIPDPLTTQSATPGSVDIIVVEDGGAGYDNYTIGSFTDPTAIAVGSNLRYALASNASDRPSFYTNCLIKMVSGNAAGEYRLIVDYLIESGRKVIVLDRPFFNRPNPGDQYEIFPNVFVNDISGSSNEQCFARAIVSPQSGNTITQVEVLAIGRDYRVAEAEVRPSNIAAPTAPAQLRPIIAPPGGHGSNINNELFAYYVGISSAFNGEAPPLIASNDFRTIGLLRNPLFNDVEVAIDSTTTVGGFQRGERVFRYRPITVEGTVDIDADGRVTGSNTTFLDSLRAGDGVLINNGVSNLFATIQAVDEQTQLQLDRPSPFESEGCTLTLAVKQYFGRVRSFRTGVLRLTDVVPRGFTVSSFLVGEQSSATTRVSNIQPNVTINGRDAEAFDGFRQLTQAVGSFASTNRFVEDEPVFVDGIEQPVGIVHSFIDNPGSSDDFLYLSNTTQNLTIQGGGSTGAIRGGISNATFIIRDKYDGELVPDSGEILYIENVSPIRRDVRQTETFKLILEF